MLNTRAGTKVGLILPNPDETTFITQMTQVRATVLNWLRRHGKCKLIAVIPSSSKKEEVRCKKLGTPEQDQLEMEMGWLLKVK